MTRYRVIFKTPEKGGKQGIVTRWRPLLTTPDTSNGRWSGKVVGRSISQLLTIHPVEASINHGDVVYTRRMELNVESDFEDEDPSTFYVNGVLAPGIDQIAYEHDAYVVEDLGDRKYNLYSTCSQGLVHYAPYYPRKKLPELPISVKRSCGCKVWHRKYSMILREWKVFEEEDWFRSFPLAELPTVDNIDVHSTVKFKATTRRHGARIGLSDRKGRRMRPQKRARTKVSSETI